MCVTLGMLFVLVMFQKRATCSVVCEIWGCCGVREERLLRKEGGGAGAGGRGGRVLFESRPWYGKWKFGGLSRKTSRLHQVSDWWFCTT